MTNTCCSLYNSAFTTHEASDDISAQVAFGIASPEVRKMATNARILLGNRPSHLPADQHCCIE
jgi:hypothetical protein